MKRSFKLLIVIAILCTILGIAAGPIRALAIYERGYAYPCTFRQIITAIYVSPSSDDIKITRIKAQGGFEQFDTTMGVFWIPVGSSNTSGLRDMLREAKENIYGITKENTKEAVVLDCGANVGVVTRTALLAGAALVVAIEPAPENVECLKRNFRAEIKSGRVIVLEKGVWDKETELSFQVVDGISEGDTFVMHPEIKGIKVPVTTIDLIVKEMGLKRVDFIKMDIEGSEQNALRGAAQTLKAYKPHLSVSGYHLPNDNVEIPRIVRTINAQYKMKCEKCVSFWGNIRTGDFEFF
jgi:FkbM family methyltransferase